MNIDYKNTLDFFDPKKEGGYLSNFYPSSFIIDNIRYNNVETYYQINKFKGETEAEREYQKLILSVQATPGKVKILASQQESGGMTRFNWARPIVAEVKKYKALGVKTRNDWDEKINLNIIEINLKVELKFLYMLKAVVAKFNQNTQLKEKLLSTGNKYLREINPYDNYWGIGKGDGRNMLGKLLTCLRESLKRESNSINEEKKLTISSKKKVYTRYKPFLTVLLEKYPNNLDWIELSSNPCLTPELIEKYQNKLNWDWLSSNPCLTHELIEKYQNKLNWDRLSINPSLTPELIEKYQNKLNWGCLSSNSSLTHELIEKYQNKLNRNDLSSNPSLTPGLIEKYPNKLYWNWLSTNPSLTPELIEKYQNKLNWDYLSSNPSLTPELIEKYQDKLNWKNLSSNSSLTLKLIEKYQDKLDWINLSSNPSLTPELIEKYQDKLDWDNLSTNPLLTPELIEKYQDKLDWFELSSNPSLTLGLIEKYKNKLNWIVLSSNKFYYDPYYLKRIKILQKWYRKNKRYFMFKRWLRQKETVEWLWSPRILGKYVKRRLEHELKSFKSTIPPTSNWLIENKVLVGAYPDPVQNYPEMIIKNGINIFVSLQTPEEAKTFRPYKLPSNVKLINYPIPDRGIISDNELLNIGKRLLELIKNGKKIFIHCYGGIGRTGSVSVVLMSLYFGYSIDESIKYVNEKKALRVDKGRKGHMLVPQTLSQKQQLERLKELLHSQQVESL